MKNKIFTSFLLSVFLFTAFSIIQIQNVYAEEIVVTANEIESLIIDIPDVTFVDPLVTFYPPSEIGFSASSVITDGLTINDFLIKGTVFVGYNHVLFDATYIQPTGLTFLQTELEEEINQALLLLGPGEVTSLVVNSNNMIIATNGTVISGSGIGITKAGAAGTGGDITAGGDGDITAGGDGTGTAGGDTASGDFNLDITIDNPLKTDIDTLPEFVEEVLRIVLKVGIPIVTLFIIYAGLLFVMAAGNPEKLKKAKETLLWTLVGAAVLLGAWVIAEAIQGTLTQLGA